jgi:hypothetical protein
LRKKIIYPQSRRHQDTVLVSLKCTYRLKYTILCDWSVIKTYQFMWFILFSYQICSLYTVWMIMINIDNALLKTNYIIHDVRKHIFLF